VEQAARQESITSNKEAVGLIGQEFVEARKLIQPERANNQLTCSN